MARRELDHVTGEVPLAHVMERAHDGALEQRPERLHAVGVHLAAHVLARRVLDRLVPVLLHAGVGRRLVGIDLRPRGGQPVEALQHGGLLTALPALLQVRLLRFADCLGSLQAYYSSASVLLLLARVPNPERLRYQAPGEWGRLPGLDRCPAPDVLRRKIAALADPPGTVREWLLALASYWCSADLQVRAALFFDGHVKVYTGQRNLARHFVSRQRLSLPAAAGFWANVPGGAPLLALSQEVDPGLRRALWDDLLPELEQLGLLPPPAADPAQEPLLTLVFDREGWSPEMFLALRARGVACVTWIKGEQAVRWPEAEFSPTDIPLRTPLGVETGRGQLAERPLDLLDGDLPAREIRFWIEERERPSGRSGQPRKARRLAGAPVGGPPPAGDPHHAPQPAGRGGRRAAALAVGAGERVQDPAPGVRSRLAAAARRAGGGARHAGGEPGHARDRESAQEEQAAGRQAAPRAGAASGTACA